MSFQKAFKRELEVAFSKHSQPVWFRVVKYIVLGCVVWFFWGTNTLWFILLPLFVVAMVLHFWYRYKTQGWRKSYGMWKHESDRK
jgi:hypothetical protein